MPSKGKSKAVVLGFGMPPGLARKKAREDASRSNNYQTGSDRDAKTVDPSLNSQTDSRSATHVPLRPKSSIVDLSKPDISIQPVRDQGVDSEADDADEDDDHSQNNTDDDGDDADAGGPNLDSDNEDEEDGDDDVAIEDAGEQQIDETTEPVDEYDGAAEEARNFNWGQTANRHFQEQVALEQISNREGQEYKDAVTHLRAGPTDKGLTIANLSRFRTIRFEALHQRSTSASNKGKFAWMMQYLADYPGGPFPPPLPDDIQCQAMGTVFAAANDHLLPPESRLDSRAVSAARTLSNPPYRAPEGSHVSVIYSQFPDIMASIKRYPSERHSEQLTAILRATPKSTQTEVFRAALSAIHHNRMAWLPRYKPRVRNRTEPTQGNYSYAGASSYGPQSGPSYTSQHGFTPQSNAGSGGTQSPDGTNGPQGQGSSSGQQRQEYSYYSPRKPSDFRYQ